VRDFQGLRPKSIDKSWNFNFGLREQTLFPEIIQDDVIKTQGMQITIVTKSQSPEDSLFFLQTLGLPFHK
jgi:large subunit ribosomal protein L5